MSEIATAGHQGRLSFDWLAGDRFLYAGEVHYFRLDPDRWAGALSSVKAAGMNAVSIYVPWNWHEWAPGSIDFSGESDPRRDLETFLERCADAALPVFLRPGPWILSEWRHGGIPDWLLREHPEVLALDAAGDPPNLDMLYPPVTYLHPAFLDRAKGWFRSLLPIVRRWHDLLMAIQIDDEVHYGWGIRCGDPLFVDYNPVVVGTSTEPGLFQAWLEARYGAIAELNDRYGSGYVGFAEVQPPREPPGRLADLPRFIDWHLCKEAMANRYVETLYDLLVGEGIDLPITVLSPYMTPYGVRRFVDFFRERTKPILVTAQCYPTLYGTGGFAEESAGHVAALTQVARDWLADTASPLISAESQAAMSFHIPPGALENLYALQLGNGADGLSLYMAVGGDNPAPFGMNTGASYDISAPIGPDGEGRPHLAVIRRTGEFLNTHGARLRRTRPLVDLAVGYYPPYETAALQGDTVDMGGRHRYDDILSQVFGLGTGAIARGGGVFSLLTAAGYTYAMLDLERTTLEALRANRQLWCLGLDFMAEAVQRKLVAYVEGGGDLVLLPQVPALDDRFRTCGVLAALLPAPILFTDESVRSGSFRMPWHTVSIAGIKGLPIADTVDRFDISTIAGAESIAFDDRRGGVCGYSVRHGAGRATLLGFKPRYGWSAHDLHRAFIRAVVGRAGVEPTANAEGGELHVVERIGEETGFLFVTNPTRWPQTARIKYLDPATNTPARIPRTFDGVSFPDQGAMILCVRARIPGIDVEIVHSTSQVQAWEVTGKRARLRLHGPAGTRGETALRRVSGARDLRASGDLASVVQHGELIIATYVHGADPIELIADA